MPYTVQLPVETQHYTVTAVDGASILLVLVGSATAYNSSLPQNKCLNLKCGSVVFISAKESLELTIESRESTVVMFRAFYT